MLILVILIFNRVIVKFVILVMLMLKVMLMTLVISRMLILKVTLIMFVIVDVGDVDVDVGHLEQEREELTVLAGDNMEVGGSVGENVE